MDRIRGLFSIDPRALAVFRVGLGLLLLVDLVLRWPHISMFYTESGVLPLELRESALSLPEDLPLAFSFHSFPRSEFAVQVSFVLAGSFALGLALGYRTRWMAVGSWLFLVSLHSRNPLVLDHGDMLLRQLSFWSMFVPLGGRASLDARGSSSELRPSAPVFGGGTLGLLLQAGLMYVFTGLLKSDPAWSSTGTALCDAFHIDQLARPPAQWLLAHHQYLHLITPLIPWGEVIGGVLLFSPFRTAALRLVLVAAFTVLQLSFAVFLYLPLFPFVSTLAVVCFLPGRFWDRVWPRSVDGPPQRGLGARDVPALVFCGFLLLNNLATLPGLPVAIPLQTFFLTRKLGVAQDWFMFAPAPSPVDGWCVAKTRLEDGRFVDAYTERAVIWEKPRIVMDRYRSYREQRQAFHGLMRDDRSLLGRYALFLLEDWNRRHGPAERATRLELYFMRELTLPGCQEAKASPTVLAVANART